jgi:16S rRNA (uracil1498-N3)-methyltransferase
LIPLASVISILKMNIFYTQNIQGNLGILDEDESYHCIKVLRLGKGKEVSLVDGKGGFFEGSVSVADQRKCLIDIKKSQYEFGRRNYRLHIAIAPTKSIERFEWFLEKATEIGIDEITPLVCRHSERKIIRKDRLEKVITSAMKQSLKAYRPVFNQITTFDEFTEMNISGNKIIAHCMDSDRQELIRIQVPGREFLLLIGPEGDFSDNEVILAMKKGFLPVSMGSGRLRTETAGIVGCQIIADLMSLR